ncbi:MAG: hypothetical protein FWD37_00185 [Methanomassiliicoccaceae archaeon]|nr:hypothetical protein [Methanomassiliicoccaceae archaeon]
MLDEERVTQSSMSIDITPDLKQESVLSAEDRARLKYMLEKHKELLMLLSQ